MNDLFRPNRPIDDRPASTRGQVRMQLARIFLRCVDCGHEWPVSSKPAGKPDPNPTYHCFTIDRPGMEKLRDVGNTACPRCAASIPIPPARLKP